MHTLQIDVVGDDPEPVRLEDHDRLAATDPLRDAVDPGDVLGGVRRAAGRELPTVAVRNVVGDENGNAALERGRLHRLAHLLLHLCRRAAGEPDGMALRDHRRELQRTLDVAVHGAGRFPAAPRPHSGRDIETCRRIERSRLAGAGRSRCQHDDGEADDGAAKRRTIMFLTVVPLWRWHESVYMAARVPYPRRAVKPHQTGSAPDPASASSSLSTSAASLYGPIETRSRLLPSHSRTTTSIRCSSKSRRWRPSGRRSRPRTPTSAAPASAPYGGRRSWNDAASRRQRSRSSDGAPRSPPALPATRPGRVCPASRAVGRSCRRRSPTR